MHNSITPFVNSFLSIFTLASRKSYSSNYVLLRLIENWKQSLDNRKFAGALLMDISETFDYVPYNF